MVGLGPVHWGLTDLDFDPWPGSFPPPFPGSLEEPLDLTEVLAPAPHPPTGDSAGGRPRERANRPRASVGGREPKGSLAQRGPLQDTFSVCQLFRCVLSPRRLSSPKRYFASPLEVRTGTKTTRALRLETECQACSDMWPEDLGPRRIEMGSEPVIVPSKKGASQRGVSPKGGVDGVPRIWGVKVQGEQAHERIMGILSAQHVGCDFPTSVDLSLPH